MMSTRALAKMIEAMNRHMPAKKRTLKDMLEDDDPSIKAKDGNEYIIEKKELEFIAEYIDEMDWSRFTVPILLEMNYLSGETVIFIRDRFHQEFLKKAFGFDRFVKDAMMIYPYEMQKVRKKLRTASQVIFKVSFK
ncbi:hypothetical protein DRP07_01435 [Archaeoglobales archaeon]|nr:MAG: hypothetical protein DRP07_01435 [Archaeoglobales archaeon]